MSSNGNNNPPQAEDSIWNKSLGDLIQNFWPATVLFILIVLSVVMSVFKIIAPDLYEERVSIFVATFNMLFGYVLCIAILCFVVWYFLIKPPKPKPAAKAKDDHH